MADGFTMEQAQEVLNSGVTQAQELLKDPSKITDLLGELQKKLEEIPVIGETVSDVPVMISMVKSYVTKEYTEVSPKVVASLVAAFLYLVSKKDIIPDSIPILGYADDLAVMGLALKLSEPELKAFQEWEANKA